MMRGARPCDSESGLRFCFGRGLLLCPPTDLTARLQSRRGPRPVKSVTGTSTTQSLWGYRRLIPLFVRAGTLPARRPSRLSLLFFPLMLHLHVLSVWPQWNHRGSVAVQCERLVCVLFLLLLPLRRSGSYGRGRVSYGYFCKCKQSSSKAWLRV